MIWLAISACVLALAAVACAVVALTISLRQRAARESWQSQTLSSLQAHSTKLDQLARDASARLRELEAHSPTKLAAKVAELDEAVLAIGDTHRRFAGRVWARIGKQHGDETPHGRAPLVDDPEFAAELALQLAPPVSPGGK